jgi:hypothetical protein
VRDVTQGSALLPQVTPAVTTQERTTRNNQNNNSPANADEAFEAFWDMVPKKTGKGEARKAWTDALKKSTAEEITAGMARYAAQCEAQRTEWKFIKTPGPWLRAERWTDAPAPLRAVSGGYQPYRNPVDQSIYDEDLT